MKKDKKKKTDKSLEELKKFIDSIKKQQDENVFKPERLEYMRQSNYQENNQTYTLSN